jgi:predicted CxxxxCH...CXXCH cytochrome family protein
VRPDGTLDLDGGRHIDGQIQARIQGCDGCHGEAGQPAPPRDLSGDRTTDAPGVGAHRAHLEGGHLRTPIACGECHPVPATLEAATHLDLEPGVTLRFGALATTGGLVPAYAPADQTCANVYCHGATLAGGTVGSPVFTRVDGRQRACDACHGAPPPSPHPARADCVTCHPGSVRADGTIDLAGGRHLDGTLDVAALGCDACHGADGDPAPPAALDGTVEPTARGVGAHDAHLRGGALGGPVACESCHLVPELQTDPGHFDPSPGAEVTFSGLAVADQTVPVYDPETLTCSGVYCHGASLGGGGGSDPVWTAPGSVEACDACHGAPPPAPHPAFGACIACHPATVRPDGTIDVVGGRHIDGQVDVLIPGCDGCHGEDGQAAPPRDLDGRVETTALGVGAHRVHLTGSSLRGPVPCASCHAVPASVVAAGHLDETPEPEVRFGGLARADGAAPTWNRATATCTGVYCHGATRPGGRDTTPVWTLVDGTQVTCGACHGAPPPPPHVASDDCALCHPRTVRRDGSINLAGNAHINGQVEISIPACGGCHGTPDEPAPPPALDGAIDPADPAVGAHATHLTGGLVSGPIACTECHVVPAQVAAVGHLDAVDGAEVTFGRLATTGGLAPRYTPATGRCDTVYCHGADLTGGTNVRLVWNVVDGTQAACGTCHGAPPPPPHSASDQCFRCHPGTVLGNGEIDLQGGLHVNGVVEAVAGHPDGWTNPDRHGAAFNAGGAGACGGCHGADLGGGDVRVSCDRCHPGWRSNCTFCHGGTDNATGAPPEGIDGETARAVFGVGSHTRHVAQTALHGAYDCARCHVRPVDALSAGHIDGDGRAEVRMDGRNAAAVYDRGASTCAATYCHGDGVAASPVVPWTVGGPLGCTACHDDQTVPRASNTLRGGHEDHVLGERFVCQECHRSVVNAVNGIVAPALHVDGSVQVAFLAAGFSYVGGRCTGSCHGENHQGERW